MLFVDLDSLKLIKSYNFENKRVSCQIDSTVSITVLSEQFMNICNTLLNTEQAPAIECCYTIDIIDKEQMPVNEKAETFVTLINVFNAAFFKCLCRNEGRKREYRLDVPENLKSLKINMSLLKRAINLQTAVNKFNIMINYDDLVYILCDAKDDIIKNDFIHEEDELDA